jgi:signal transduction histidine kinase
VTPSQFEELLISADHGAVVASLARGMAHDLRGPLQTLTLMVDPDADLFGGPEAGRLRGAVGNSVQHLTDTVNRFSQVYAPPTSEPTPLIAEDLLSYVADLQRYQRSLAAVEVELRLPGGLPAVRGMELMIRHQLLSLIVNAKQALADRTDGRITLSASATEGEVRLMVDDNGPGVAVEDRGRAFEPFYSTRPGSFGIGLTVVRCLAERQAGSASLEEAPGGGARAMVVLPAWRRGATV